MMKQFTRALLWLCLLLPLGTMADDADHKPFSNIFVFGDSLSDTGNLAAFADLQVQLATEDPNARVGLCFFDLIPILTPDGTIGLELKSDFPCNDLFFMSSRVSNGPVAVEVLAKRLGFENLGPSLHPVRPVPNPQSDPNYAVAGARANPDSTDPLDVLAGFPLQVDSSLADRLFSAPPDALYVIVIGGNDVRAARGALLPSPSGETPDQIITEALSKIEEKISALISAGAKTFLVVNVVDIGSLPETRKLAGIVEDMLGIPAELTIKRTTLLTKEFNVGLAEVVRRIELDQEQMGNSIELRKFNLFALFKVIRFVGGLFGLNAVDPCFNTDNYRDTGSREFHPDCGPDKFGRFIYFDDIHPTGRVHATIGKVLAVGARRLADKPRHRALNGVRLGRIGE